MTSMPWRDQAVDDLADRLLVAGNSARGKDHAVAPRQRYFRMLVARDARQRRARLALAAGAQRNDLVRRQIAIAIRAPKILHAVEMPGLARDLRHALHGAADKNNLTLCGAGGTGDGTQAADMGSKSRHRDAARCGADQFGQCLGHVRLRRRTAVTNGIGGIADQRQHTGIAERGQFG